MKRKDYLKLIEGISYNKYEIDTDMFNIDKDVQARKHVVISDESINSILEAYKDNEKIRLQLNGSFSNVLQYIFREETNTEMLEQYIDDIYQIDSKDIFLLISYKIKNGSKDVIEKMIDVSKKYISHLLGEDRKLSSSENLYINYVIDILVGGAEVGKDYIFYLLDYFIENRQAQHVKNIFWRFSRSLEEESIFRSNNNGFGYITVSYDSSEVYFRMLKIILNSRYGKDIYYRYFNNEISGYSKFKHENGKLYLKSNRKLTKKDLTDFSFLLIDYNVFDSKIVESIMNGNSFYKLLDGNLNNNSYRKSDDNVAIWKKFIDINEIIPDEMIRKGFKYIPMTMIENKRSACISDEKVLKVIKNNKDRFVRNVLGKPEEYLSDSLAVLLKLNPGVLDEN
jgi:hypothetical protein